MEGKLNIAVLPHRNIQKHRSQSHPENFGYLLEQAIQLRKEVPERSVAKIIYILEAEGLVAPGVLKRSTLERHIYKAGYGRKQMQMYKEARSSSSKRFCKPHRMMLIQGVIKYGPKLPIGKNGAKIQTYLSSAIDDHSRYLLPPGFMITRRKPSLRTPSIRRFPDMERLMPATLITEASTLQNRSGSRLPGWGSVSCMQNRGRARAKESHMDYSGCARKVFTAKALDEIHKASAGIPRMVNRICEKALMYAFQNQKRLIDDYMIRYVVEHEMLGTITT